jgi:hypothetical protein
MQGKPPVIHVRVAVHLSAIPCVINVNQMKTIKQQDQLKEFLHFPEQQLSCSHHLTLVVSFGIAFKLIPTARSLKIS